MHTGPWRSGTWQRRGVTGEEEAGVTGEAAHGPRRSSGGAARDSVPAVRRRAAASASLLWPAGAPPCPRPVLARLAPDFFPSLFPDLPPPRPWLQDGGAETDHVSGGRVR